MAYSSRGILGLPHWMYAVARYWVRTQLTLASALVVGLVSISLGLNPIPRTIPLQDIVNRYPGPAFGLGSALVVVSALAFVLARNPDSSTQQLTAGTVGVGLEQQPAGVAVPSGAERGFPPQSYPAQLPPTFPTLPPAPADPPRPRQRGWAAAGIIGLMVLSLAIAGSGVGLAVSSAHSLVQQPIKLLVDYCGDVRSQDYVSAYQLMSRSAQRQFQDSPTEYQHLSHLRDVLDGPVQQCGPQPADTAAVVENNQAKVTAAITRQQTYLGTVHLVYEQNGWRIDQLDASLLGTDVVPLAVAENFCDSLVNRNYGLAFDAMSSARQQYIGTVDDLVTAMFSLGDNTTNVSFQQCASQYKAYVPPSSADPSSATAVTIITLRATSTTDTTCTDYSYSATMTLVVEGGTWKVDSLDTGDNPSQQSCPATS